MESVSRHVPSATKKNAASGSQSSRGRCFTIRLPFGHSRGGQAGLQTEAEVRGLIVLALSKASFSSLFARSLSLSLSLPFRTGSISDVWFLFV